MATTRVAEMRLSGMVAPRLLDGPATGDRFGAYVDQVLVPTLKPDDVVIINSLSSHKRSFVKLFIDAAGASLAFLPRHSPDFKPIRKAVSKLKANLHRAGKRTVPDLSDVIGGLVTMFNAYEFRNNFSSCDYEAC